MIISCDENFRHEADTALCDSCLEDKLKEAYNEGYEEARKEFEDV